MLYDSQTGNMNMALTGESLITRGLKTFREERFLKLVDILRNADVTFTNAEVTFHNSEGSPCEETDGTYMRCDPRFLEDLKWAGFDVAACAMNHAYDSTEVGVLKNIENLNAYGIVNAGTGKNMTLARAPGYLDTSKGRVALLSATDHIDVPAGRAGEERPDMKGRPGANVLQVKEIYTVDRATFDDLRRISDKVGFEAQKAAARRGRYPQGRDVDTDTLLHFGPGIGGRDYSRGRGILRFQLGEDFGYTTIIDDEDWEGNLKWIRDARRMADWILYSFHCGYRGQSGDDPPDHLIKIAHEAIDNGVDVFIGHGPHRDKGIEIYKGRPIFYSIGDFILQNDTPEFQTADGYARYGLTWENTPADFYDARSLEQTVAQDINPENWQSHVAVLEWKGKELKEIKLHPIDLGIGLPMGQRGRPVLADGDVANEILERLQRCSKRFNTRIDAVDGIGVIKVG